MKTAFVLACIQLASPAPLLVPVAHSAAQSAAQSGYLSGQVSGIRRQALNTVDLRVRFYLQRSGGEPLEERFFFGVELIQGSFSVAIDTVPEHRSLLFVEVGLRPSDRHYAVFATLAPRRRLRPDTSLALVMDLFAPEMPGIRSEPYVLIRSNQQPGSPENPC